MQKDRIIEVRPQILRRACGGWLAVSPRLARFSLGVTAETEKEAEELFRFEFARWVSIVDDTLPKILDIPK